MLGGLFVANEAGGRVKVKPAEASSSHLFYESETTVSVMMFLFDRY